MSPEICIVVVRRIIPSCGRKPTEWSNRQAAVLKAKWRADRTPPGSENRACMHRDNSGTWEGRMSPCRSRKGMRATGRTKAPGIGVVSRMPISENREEHGTGERAESEGFREGHQAVLADHSTWEGGEPKSKGPTGGKERPGMTNCRKETWKGLWAYNPCKRIDGGLQHGQQQSCAKWGVACLVCLGRRPLATDEPDVLIGLVRVCGGSGGQPLLLPGSPTPNNRFSFSVFGLRRRG